MPLCAFCQNEAEVVGGPPTVNRMDPGETCSRCGYERPERPTRREW